MSFIDWSDPEALFSLLVEYVEDERADSRDDARRRFLDKLVAQLSDLETQLHRLSDEERSNALREMAAAVDAEFEDDPVVSHLSDCADELERATGS
ncbi:hypothetical protein [Tahibacter soli]|uniref:Uncharacterized protein n=1 Tax=Tahibacter soli TaxID=2983605 RepID=A0A9X3YRJ6_9GAMM|nr:hypothetical protein [Tahibacter soli]MDC8016205.1 hypothetical protein [Tahibacter soli]